MVESEILAYYQRNDVRDRLASGGRQIEFLRGFHRPEDPAAEVGDAGLRLDEIVGANGIVKLLLPDLPDRLDDDARREEVTGLLRLLEAEPALLGVSQNLVAIARVPSYSHASGQNIGNLANPV